MRSKPLIGLNADFRAAKKDAPAFSYVCSGYYDSIIEAGAKAAATSSWSVAAAQGYDDGEDIPVEFVEKIIARIVEKVKAPVSVDFEVELGAVELSLHIPSARVAVFFRSTIWPA